MAGKPRPTRRAELYWSPPWRRQSPHVTPRRRVQTARCNYAPVWRAEGPQLGRKRRRAHDAQQLGAGPDVASRDGGPHLRRDGLQRSPAYEPSTARLALRLGDGLRRGRGRRGGVPDRARQGAGLPNSRTRTQLPVQGVRGWVCTTTTGDAGSTRDGAVSRPPQTASRVGSGKLGGRGGTSGVGRWSRGRRCPAASRTTGMTTGAGADAERRTGLPHSL